MNLIIKENKFFIFMLLLTGVIDFINGVIIQKSSNQVSFGQIVRIIFFIIMLFYIIRNFKIVRYSKLYFSILYYFILDTMLTFYSHQDVTATFNDLIIVCKYMLPITIIVCGLELIKLGKINYSSIKKIINFNSYFIPGSLIICYIFKIGYVVYDSGFSGYFCSNNELSIVLSFLFIINFDFLKLKLVKGEFEVLYIFKIFLSGIALFIIGSKTSLIIVSLVACIYIFIILKNTKRKIYIIAFFGLFIFGIFSLKSIISISIINIINYQKYNINYYAGNIITYIFNNRNNQFDYLWTNFCKPNLSIATLLFGFKKGIMFGTNSSFMSLELDLLCTFINYGIIGLSLLVAFYYRLYVDSRKNHNFGFRLSYLIFILFGSISGHVLFSAFAGTFFAIISIGLVIDKTNI